MEGARQRHRPMTADWKIADLDQRTVGRDHNRDVPSMIRSPTKQRQARDGGMSNTLSSHVSGLVTELAAVPLNQEQEIMAGKLGAVSGGASRCTSTAHPSTWPSQALCKVKSMHPVDTCSNNNACTFDTNTPRQITVHGKWYLGCCSALRA